MFLVFLRIPVCQEAREEERTKVLSVSASFLSLRLTLACWKHQLLFSSRDMWKFAPVIIHDRHPNAPPSTPLPPPALYASNHELCLNRTSLQLTTYYPSVVHQRQATNTADPLTQCVATIYWLVVLIFISIPISFIALVLFIFISPMAACVPFVGLIDEFLLKIAHFPTLCARNLVQAKSPGCFF